MLIIVLAETKIRVFRKKPITREQKRPNIVPVPLFSDGPGTKTGPKRSHTPVLGRSGNENGGKTFPHPGSGTVRERKRGQNVPHPGSGTVRERKRGQIVPAPRFWDGPGTKTGSKRSRTTVLGRSGNENRGKTFPHHGSGMVRERKRGSNVPAPRFWDGPGTETGLKRSRTPVLGRSGNENGAKTFPHPGSGTVRERKWVSNVPAHLLWLWEQPLHFSRSQVERLNNLSVGRTESEFHHFCSLVGNLFFQLPYFLAWKPA